MKSFKGLPLLNSVNAGIQGLPETVRMVLGYLLVDAPMRLWKTDRPVSILRLVSTIGHKACDIGHQLCDIVSSFDALIDGIVPQRTVPAAAPAASVVTQ
jgi:hypothetical protein